MRNISINAGTVMQETYEEMKETMFRYSALQEYAKSVENSIQLITWSVTSRHHRLRSW